MTEAGAPEHRDVGTSRNGTRLPSVGRAARRRQKSALGVFAVVALAVLVWIALPIGIGIFLGTLVAFAFQSSYDRLLFRGWRPRWAALACVGASVLAVAAVLGAMGYLLVSRGVVMAEALLGSLGPEGATRAFILRTASRLPREFQADELIGRLRNAAAELASRVGLVAAAIVNATFSSLLSGLFMAMTIYFVLRNWPTIARRAEQVLPLHPRYTRALLDEFRLVGRTTLLGTVVTGLVQGALATLGYWMFGAPEPAFFGAATAVASLLPAVGTMLVWGPVGLYLLLTDHVVSGVLLLAYGTLVVVGASDYIVRPRLVGAHAQMPALFTLMSLFGGLEVFGLVGLILGPILVSLALAVLRLYAKEQGGRRKTTA